MRFYAARQYHRRLPSLCLIFLLFGISTHVGFCHRRGISGGRDVSNIPRGATRTQRRSSRSNVPLRPDLEEKTDELIALLLAKRSLQEEDELESTENEIPANGCFICEGNTFFPDKVPNQNILLDAPYGNATCQVWQNHILPVLTPDGENCRSDYFYRDLYVSCCSLAIPRYQCEENVHNFLSSNENYNIAVPPIVSHDKPLIVITDVIFEKADQIDVMSGRATIQITVTLKWKDPRLSWTIDSETTCADYIDLWTGYTNQDTLIWVPDIDLLNQVEGFQQFSKSLARVSADGSVEWLVFGMITASCSFKGLANIPFDVLGCQFIFGPRARSNANMIHYQFPNEQDINVGRNDLKYKEFMAVPELFEKGYTWYYHKEYGQAMYYNFYFRRATNFYFVNTVLPATILTYCSFGTFLLDMRVGERLGFVMAFALVIVAAQIVTFDLVPVSSSKLWIDKFVAWSFYWVLFVLLQSVCIAFISVIREDHKAKIASRNEIEANAATNRAVEETDETEYNTSTRKAVDTRSRKESKEIEGHQIKEKHSWFWTNSLRKFDYICMIFCMVTYTIFNIFMYISNFKGMWVQNEPEWNTPMTAWGFDTFPNNHYKDPNVDL